MLKTMILLASVLNLFAKKSCRFFLEGQVLEVNEISHCSRSKHGFLFICETEKLSMSNLAGADINKAGVGDLKFFA